LLVVSLRLLESGEELVELAVPLVPEALVLGEPRGGFAQRLRLEMADAGSCLTGAGDEAGLLEHLQVARDGRLRHLERRRQGGNRRVALRKPGEDRTPRGIRQRREDRVEVNRHL
jgi:hypothetical protein